MTRMLLIAAALATASFAGPAAAQSVVRDLPATAVQRPVLDASSLLQRLRDRGVAEDKVQVTMARIRAAIASGKYPHLERRLYNAMNPGDTTAPNRRRYLAATPTESRPDARPTPDRDITRDVAREPARNIRRDAAPVRDVRNVRAP